MSDAERIPTAHGEVEYETVECVSCEQRVAETHTTDVIVGDVTDVGEYNTLPNKYQFGNGKERGHVCELCRDDPIRYPRGRVFDALGSVRAIVTAALFVFGVWLL